MKQKLLLIALMAAIIISATANLSINLRNKMNTNNLVATLKTQGKSKKGHLSVSPINQRNSTAKVKAVGPINTFPYLENFDASDITTDGWLITDASTTADANMGVGTLSGLSALSGSSYLISGYDTPASRNAWAFSPAISLTAGVTYHIYVWAYASGYNGVNDEFKVTVGAGQTAAAQTTLIIDKTGANSAAIDTWTRLEGTYTPSANGDYNFAISHCTAQFDVNYVAFENFAVSDKEYIEAPIVSTHFAGGLCSASAVVNDSIYLAGDEPLYYIPSIIGATSFSWSFDTDATASSLTDTIPSVSYTTTALHVASLNATGPGGVTNKDASHYIVKPKANVTNDIVYNIKSYDSFANYQSSSTNSYMYLAGPNGTDYKKIAEKFEIPDNTTVSLSQIYMYVGKYTLSTANKAKAFTIQILKADGTNGLPGTVVSTVTPTFSTVFGTAAISTATMKSYTYTTPVSITGSYYISLDFTNVGTPSATNFVGLYTTEMRSYPDCSLYAYYQSAWTPMYDLFGELSAFIAPKITYQAVTAVNNPSSTNFKAFVSGANLHIENATSGQSVTLYDLAGHIVYNQKLKAANEVLPISLKKGMYLVKAAEKTVKVIVD